MLKKNDLIELEIDGMTNLGFGVGRHGGMAIFVGGAVIGDKVSAKIIKLAPSYAIGRIESILSPSDRRTDRRCECTACSACAYKSISYEAELEIKWLDIQAAFKKAELNDIKILPPIPSPKLTEYRNKAQYPICVSKNGEYTVGFYAPKSHRVREARACPLAPPEFKRIIDTLVEFFKEHRLSCYDEESGKGLLRHIYLRRGELSGEIMLTLVINGTSLPYISELQKLLEMRHPEIRSFLLNENLKATNIILGEKFHSVMGDGKILDTLAGVKLEFTPNSFYQVNHSAAEILYKKALALAAPQKSDTILDLYCGVGSIGLSMAKHAGEVIGIEIVADAVKMARENAKINGISNAKFYTGDASFAKKLLEGAERERGEKIKPDIVILDPPRGGTSEELIEFISELAPKKVVYISCNPQTLARDIRAFRQNGYSSDVVEPVDLFPATGHCEAICLITRK